MLLLYASWLLVVKLVSFAIVRCQHSASDQSHGQAARLWPGHRCWPTSWVGTTSGTASYGVVRSDVVGGCGLVADFAVSLSMDDWHVIFDVGNVGGQRQKIDVVY